MKIKKLKISFVCCVYIFLNNAFAKKYMPIVLPLKSFDKHTAKTQVYVTRINESGTDYAVLVMRSDVGGMIGSPLNINANSLGSTNIGGSQGGQVTITAGTSSLNLDSSANPLNLNTNSTDTGSINIGNANSDQITIYTGTNTTPGIILQAYTIQITGDTEIIGEFVASAGVRFPNVGNITGDTVMIDANGNIGRSSSSARYKNGIVDIEIETIDKISLLSPCIFSYKNDIETYGINAAPKMYGFIAEEVEEVDENLVIHKDGIPESLYFNSIFSLAVAQLIRLKSRFDALEKEYSDYRNTYENKIELLENKIALLMKKHEEL